MESGGFPFGRSRSDLMMLIAGLVVSFVIFTVIESHETEIAERDFQRLAGAVVGQVEQNISRSAREVNHLAAFIEHSDNVSSEAFAGFSARFLEENPAVYALEWTPRVTQNQRLDFERTESERHPNFEITQFRSGIGLVAAEQRPVYFPIYHIEPWPNNSLVHGFDMASNPERRKMLEQVLEHDELVLSSAIRMMQDKNSGFGFIAAVHVFDGENRRDSDLASNESLKGFAIGVFQFQPLLEYSMRNQTHEFGQLDLFEILDDGYERLLFSHAEMNSDLGEMDFTLAAEFTLGGKRWKVVVGDSATSYSISRSWLAYVFLGLGLLISFLLLDRMFFVKRSNEVLIKTKRELHSEATQRLALEGKLQDSNDELDLLLYKDPLLSIPNRSHFESYLQTEWKRMTRTGKPLSLIIADIDFFKLYNDHYGHTEGDESLRKIAETFEACVRRPSDLVARSGGEEFIFVLPETQAVDALNIAHKLRRKVEFLRIKSEPSKVSPYLTISLGTYTMDKPNAEIPNTLIVMAGQALYQAKQSGRNRVVSLVFDYLNDEASDFNEQDTKETG